MERYNKQKILTKIWKLWIKAKAGKISRHIAIMTAKKIKRYEGIVPQDLVARYSGIGTHSPATGRKGKIHLRHDTGRSNTRVARPYCCIRPARTVLWEGPNKSVQVPGTWVDPVLNVCGPPSEGPALSDCCGQQCYSKMRIVGPCLSSHPSYFTPCESPNSSTKQPAVQIGWQLNHHMGGRGAAA